MQTWLVFSFQWGTTVDLRRRGSPVVAESGRGACDRKPSRGEAPEHFGILEPHAVGYAVASPCGLHAGVSPLAV
ncbi:hypothetical protein Pth03_79250 [Planotetraspora thailandica]|uniref:Uncharacterized protein n=1 Tax=Planotetraspora thailandica TaxID=487172 RepID=A0A8J4DFL3_9ACTN|nr:hypothetical protein Pth03_79250 [Planotetraspora thailandica]